MPDLGLSRPGETPQEAPEFRSVPVRETPKTIIEKIEKRFPEVGYKLRKVGKKFTEVSDKFQTGLGLTEIAIGTSTKMAVEIGEKKGDHFNNRDETILSALRLTDDGIRRIFEHSAKYFQIFIDQSIFNQKMLLDLLAREAFTIAELRSLAIKHQNYDANELLNTMEEVQDKMSGSIDSGMVFEKPNPVGKSSSDKNVERLLTDLPPSTPATSPPVPTIK